MMSSKQAQSRLTARQVAVYFPYHSKREHDIVKRECLRVVRQARQQGAIVRQPCETCGLQKSEAHHDDYAKPLDVRWLCRYHHRLRDADLREAWRARVRALRTDSLPVAVSRLVGLMLAVAVVVAGQQFMIRCTPWMTECWW